ATTEGPPMKQGISPRVLDACGLGRAPRGPAMLGATTLLLAGLWTSLAEARRIYVDQNGVGGTCSENRDWATAQNPASPVCSIETGIALAQTGDTVMVRGGRYLRSGPLGTGKSNFALMAYPGEHVTLDFAAATVGNGINFNVNNVLLE